MDPNEYKRYLQILKNEMIPAMGCTEPIAIAYAAAVGRKYFKWNLDRIDAFCSGNIIKNVKSVIIPNTDGMRGLEAAVLVGFYGGDPDKKLEVLSSVTKGTLNKAKEMLQRKVCVCHLEENVAGLYIRLEVTGEGHMVCVILADDHTGIQLIERDGEVLFSTMPVTNSRAEDCPKIIVGQDTKFMTVRSILTFAEEVRIADVKELLDKEIELNSAISEEGLHGNYGAEVGRTLLAAGGSVEVRACAEAAAGSDARMNGCVMPVVINSGSGNQGITCSVPVIVYAKELHASQEKLYRALIISNLVSIHQKSYIGKLSAFCGAVSASCGTGAAIAYLNGADYSTIADTIINTLANLSGVVCDGAKSSCAAKIASSVDAAILAYKMSMSGHSFHSGDGIVEGDVEQTIKNVGYLGKVGMKSTDVTILNMMVNDSAQRGEK